MSYNYFAETRTEVLNFEKSEGSYRAKFACTGPCMVQLMRENNAPRVLVYGNLPGMNPVVVDEHRSDFREGLLFGVDLPGTEITVVSTSEVTEGKVMFY